MEPVKLENTRKIAVLRASALGDLIVTLPALEALRAAYPQAEITLLGRPWQKHFLKPGRTVTDRVVIVPASPGLRTPEPSENISHDNFFAAMEKEHFDMAISFQGKGVSGNALINRLGSRLTIGTWSPGAELTDRFLPYYYYQHEVLRNLELVQLAGAKPRSLEPRLQVLPEDFAEIALLDVIANKKPFVIFNPFAADIRRTWPLENYIPLAHWFYARGISIVFTGSAQDAESFKDVLRRITVPTTLAFGISFGAVTALASLALMAIGPDTGPLHLARAVDCPTIGIYWAPNMINWSPLSRTIHRPLISWILNCPYCGTIPNEPHPFEPTDFCTHEVSFVRSITPEEVIRAAESLLELEESKNKSALNRLTH